MLFITKFVKSIFRLLHLGRFLVKKMVVFIPFDCLKPGAEGFERCFAGR